MLFNSVEFPVFFLIVLALYTALRRSLALQNGLILVASYVFYGWWDVRFLFLIVLSTCLDFTAALMIERGELARRSRWIASIALLLAAYVFLVVPHEGSSLGDPAAWWPSALRAWTPLGITALVVVVLQLAYAPLTRMSEDRRRRFFVTASVVGNLGLLAIFKYLNFFVDSFAVLLEQGLGMEVEARTLNIVLPVGISFYTFQTMSYTIDVYRRQMPACTSFLQVSAYVAFFPQLVAGPIERAVHLLPQFQSPRKTDWAAWRSGLWLITWGLYKKMVIADNVAILVNEIFGPYDAGEFAVPDDGLRLLLGVYAFAIQIYGDFSGYTDIARGTARLMGFDLSLNFNLPYFATSPSAFWRRWHISLSTWLRDYLYIGLGGNRGGAWNTYRNLSLTMILGGLWHGASWTFVLWGIYHGALLVVYRVLGVRTEKGGHGPVMLAVLGIVMFHFTCLGWLIFRAQNVGTISAFLQGIVTSPQASADFWRLGSDLLYYSWFLILVQIVQGVSGKLELSPNLHWFLRFNVWIFVVMSLLALANTKAQEFIYFAF